MADLHPMLGKWVCHITDLEQEAPALVTFVGQFLDGTYEYMAKQFSSDGVRALTFPAVEMVEVEAPNEPHIGVSHG